MTICIAAICERRSKNPKVLLAGDRMVTADFLSVEFEHPDPKLYNLCKNCSMATAGDAIAHTGILSKAREKLSVSSYCSIPDIVVNIKDAYYLKRAQDLEDSILKKKGIKSLKDFYHEYHQKMNVDILKEIHKEIDDHDCDLEILIAGVDDSGAHISCVNDPSKADSYDDIGYHAIGIGDPHAMSTFISSMYNADCSLPEALYTVYKAKKLSENAPGVGKQTDIWVISKDGKIIVSNDTLNKLDEYYNDEIRMKNELKNQLVKERKFDDIIDKITALEKKD